MSKKNSYIIFGVMILAALVMTVIGYRMGREFGYRAGMEAGQGIVSEHGQTRPGQAQEDQLQPGQEQDGQSRVGGPQVSEAQELLFNLNRSSIENIDVEGGTVYVIGHQSPDSDTVCSAIAYARLLTMLGVNAEAAVTDKLNNETAYILREAGVKAPPVLEDASGKDIFLVDHSELAQSAAGLDDANIITILDHHAAGTVTTSKPLIYDARPLGATATIICIRFYNYGLTPSKQTAMMMLGAILSDTHNLIPGATTEADRIAANTLSEMAGVSDTNALYREMFKALISYDGMTDEEIFLHDYKEYEAGGKKFGIGCVDVYDEKEAMDMAARMKDVVTKSPSSTGMDMAFAQVSVFHDDLSVTYLIPSDEKAEELLKTAFGDRAVFDGTSYVLKPGISRKKEMVPAFKVVLENNQKK